MQLTCSKCKKGYHVDASKIPPGVTGTRCRACGNSIPFRRGTPQTPPPRAAQSPQPPPRPAQAQPSGATLMQISCLYCSQKYQINPKAIPAGVTSTRCKSCGHTIWLKPKVTKLKRPDPAQPAQQTTGTREIPCLYCGKKYSIDAAKIPAGMTTTKCKACGRNMSLLAAQSGIAAFKSEIDKKAIQLQQQKAQKRTAPTPADLPPAVDVGQPVTPIWKKPMALAAAAGILIVVLAGYFAAGHGSKLSGSRFGPDKIIGKKPAIQKAEPGLEPKAATAAAEPFLALKLNVPLLMEAIDRNLPEHKKDIKYKMATGIFRSFGLSRLQLYLYPDPQHAFLPVILAESEEGQNLEKQLKSQGNYIQFLEPVSDGGFRIKTEVLPEDRLTPFPIDRYRIQFVDHTAVLAPENLSRALKEGQDFVLSSQVAQMMASIAQPEDLAVLAVRVPENFSNDWQKKIRGNPALQQNPQAAMVAAMGGGVLAQLSEPLKDVESLAIGFRLDESNGRVLRYAQQFREGVDGNRIYQQLQSRNPDDLNVDGLVSKLIELFNDPRYRHKIDHENNHLMLELNWEKLHDKSVLATLSEATLGPLFAQGMELTPSKGPVAAQYDAAPNLSTDIDIDDLKKTIPAALQQRLFPGNYWSAGDQPRMTLALDTLDVPNASMARMTYEVLDVVSADGTRIMRVEENQFQHIINPGDVSPGNIDINVQPGIPAEVLGTAKIRFNIALPTRLKKLEFRSSDEPGTEKASDTVRVKLRRLEKDVAKITFRGGVSARLFAFDKTGRSLVSGESMSSSSSAAARFQGEIRTLMVVVVQEMLDYPFEVAVDLNAGKALTLSHKPEKPKRPR